MNLQTILTQNAEMTNDLKNGGTAWENSPLFDQLVNYYADEIPYGVLTGDEGIPAEWIAEKVCEM